VDKVVYPLDIILGEPVYLFIILAKSKETISNKNDETISPPSQR
jgi:hypothetical protein